MDFTRYIASEQARVLAYVQDAQDFYQMGPGIAEDNPVTYEMAGALQRDFFDEIDAVANGDLSRAAKAAFYARRDLRPWCTDGRLIGLGNTFHLARHHVWLIDRVRGKRRSCAALLA